jgi:hypothetical protein
MEGNMVNLEGFVPMRSDLRGWQSDSPIFDRLVSEVKPTEVIEVGSWKGASAIHMAKACRALGLKTAIHCVDTWLGAVEFRTMGGGERDLMERFGYPQVYYQFLSNVVNEGVADMIDPLPVTSLDGAKLLGKADLIYIDASHDLKSVTEDIEAYMPLLRDGGVMFGDDYGNSVFQVREAVDGWCARNGVTPEIYDGWFWVIRR